MQLFLAGALLLLLIAGVPPAATAATVPSGFTHTTYATGISRGTAMAIAPDGRIFVAEQGGAVRVIRGGVINRTPFITLDTDSSGERGLNGIALDPNFATNRFVYVYYTAKFPVSHNRVSRLVADGDVALAGSERPILDLDNLSTLNHMGGALNFGLDGKLYITVGDNGTPANAQNLGNLLGKVLRIGTDGSIPSDNPFVAQTTGRNQAIWGLGLRNPFTSAVQPGSGRMFINDVGQDAWEEVNEVARGANFGWPTTEGPTSDPRFRSPFYAYNHSSGGCAITGGAFYNPPAMSFPGQYAGSYFFADFCGNWIKRLDPSTGVVTDFVSATNSEPIDIKIGTDGALYYLARAGGASGIIARVGYNSTQAPTITQHPTSQLVSVGRSATFTTAAAGTQPLSYQWQRNGVNIPGATSASYTITASTADNQARFRCVVTNSAGSAVSNEAVLTVTTNQPPTATITSPIAGATYAAGDVVAYAGSASDPETGALAAGAFTWWVDFHHDTHAHPFIAPVSGSQSGQFTIPITGETASNVWYRIHVQVRDSAGLTAETTRDIAPRTSTISLQTDPTGLTVNLDDQPRTTPFATQGVVGMLRKIEAPATQSLAGVPYEFVGWSDGWAAAHNVTTSPQNTTYIATYRAVSPPVATTPPPVVVPTPDTASAPPVVVAPTPTPTPTVRPPVNRSIRITKVLYNPPGRDSRFNLNGEYLRLKNIGRAAVSLTGWTVRDAAGWTYTFPRTRLSAGASITLFTGKGTASSTRRYWKRTRYVWNNTGRESARLRDGYRRTVDSCTWTSGRRGYATC